MQERQAILIANSISYGERSKNVPVGVVQSIVRDLSGHLDNLGEFSFKVTQIVNQTTDKAKKSLLQAIRRARTAGSLLLLYYFGHGVKSPKDELFLYFKDSDWLEPPTMLKFEDIVGWLIAYKVPKVVVVLDCCHAGMVAKNLRILDSYGGDHFLLASVAPREKAMVDYGDERPIGVFSKFFLDGFNDQRAREPLTRNVSFKSLFTFVDEMTTQRSRQLPYAVDGGLASEVFFKQVTEPVIARGVRSSAPKKSSYRKLFLIGSYLLTTQFPTDDTLYTFLKKKKPEEFLTPIKVGPGTVEYDFVGRDAFGRYLELGRMLGLLEPGEPLRLTAHGKRMMRRNGAFYNLGLLETLESVWGRYGLKIADFEDVIGMRMRNNDVPSGNGIYVDMYLSKKVPMRKDMFNVLLDLTGYVGALKYSAHRTFFPAISQERQTVE